MAIDDDNADVLETIIDTTLDYGKLYYRNEVMSSLLAKIKVTLETQGVSKIVMLNNVAILMEWYDMYQAGVLDANITGTKLSEMKK